MHVTIATYDKILKNCFRGVLLDFLKFLVQWCRSSPTYDVIRERHDVMRRRYDVKPSTVKLVNHPGRNFQENMADAHDAHISFSVFSFASVFLLLWSTHYVKDTQFKIIHRTCIASRLRGRLRFKGRCLFSKAISCHYEQSKILVKTTRLPCL